MHIKISMRKKKEISMNHCLSLILMHLFISVHVYRPCKTHMTAFSKNDNKNFLRRQCCVEGIDAGINCFDSPKISPVSRPKQNKERKTSKTDAKITRSQRLLNTLGIIAKTLRHPCLSLSHAHPRHGEKTIWRGLRWTGARASLATQTAACAGATWEMHRDGCTGCVGSARKQTQTDPRDAREHARTHAQQQTRRRQRASLMQKNNAL